MKKNTHILLAEDDKNLGNVLTAYLEAKSYPTDLCSDGKIAFETFKRGKFDFCILDIMMPEMDGFTLAKNIRKIDKDIPILFLTAKSMQEDRIQGFEVGAVVSRLPDGGPGKSSDLLDLVLRQLARLGGETRLLFAMHGGALHRCDPQDAGAADCHGEHGLQQGKASTMLTRALSNHHRVLQLFSPQSKRRLLTSPRGETSIAYWRPLVGSSSGRVPKR